MKQYENVKVPLPKRSVFDLSHERKFTCQMGNLIPVLMSEVIPGDKFNVRMETLVRFHPMIAPVMHRINVFIHFFFVPYRIIWDEFEDFITGGKLGTDTTNLPMIEDLMEEFYGSSKFQVGSLADYLGIPVQNIPNESINGVSLSQLPFRAYQQIYNDYYRDETLNDDVEFLKDSVNKDVADSVAEGLLNLQFRCWEKDYFTSALPFTQRGDDVTLPLGDYAYVSGIPAWNKATGGLPESGLTEFDGLTAFLKDSQPDPLKIIKYEVEDGLKADLSTAASATINDVRRAFALQRWMEKNARAGYRYTEQILSHFGVKSKDSRLQRAEYLGGGKQPVVISEVLQTSKDEAGSPLGDLGGHGYAAGENATFKRTFSEHGIVLGIMSIMPRTAYYQGVPRLFLKNDKYDFFWPELANIGEQEVYNCELYYGDTANDSTFGYQPRYEEYRHQFDSVHGDMRTNLEFWHLGRKFTSRPNLNSGFVLYAIDNRIFSELTYDPVIVQTYCNFKAIRPIPKMGIPI